MRLWVAVAIAAACSGECGAFEPLRSGRSSGFEELNRPTARQPAVARSETPKTAAPRIDPAPVIVTPQPKPAEREIAAAASAARNRPAQAAVAAVQPKPVASAPVVVLPVATKPAATTHVVALPPPPPVTPPMPVRIAVALPPQPRPPVIPPLAPQVAQPAMPKPALTGAAHALAAPVAPTISEIAASVRSGGSDDRRIPRGAEEPPVQVAMAPPTAAPSPVIRQILPGLPVSAPARPVSPDALWKDRLGQALAEGERLGISAAIIGDIRRFYAARGMKPLFTAGDSLARAGEATTDVARRADTHGLDPKRLASLIEASGRGAAQNREVALAALAINYARDARGARFNPAQLGSLVVSRPALPDGAAVLAALADATEPATALEGFNPPHAGYQALRKQLALARHGAVAAPPVQGLRPIIMHGPELDVGMMDSRVTLLRQRLNLAAAEDVIYDEDVAEEVTRVQRSASLPPTGVLDRATIDHLNGAQPVGGTKLDPVAVLIINMERWRWLPADLGEAHVFVNIPAFMLQFRQGDRVALESRVIVGESVTPTPLMSHRIDHMIINPSWNVPPNIARREYMPLLKDAPEELAEEGIKVQRTANGVRFYQPPGDRNGLGRIKLVFPNAFTVHLHDTPDRELFSAGYRADSNGCVRVEDPFALAEAVLGGSHTKAQLTAMIGQREKRIDLVQKIPVHLAYFTYEVQADGALAVHEDVYGHDRKMRVAMGL